MSKIPTKIFLVFLTDSSEVFTLSETTPQTLFTINDATHGRSLNNKLLLSGNSSCKYDGSQDNKVTNTKDLHVAS